MDAICHPATAWPDLTSGEPHADPSSPEGILHQQQIDYAEALAWTTYRGLTGNTVSICPTTVRPIAGRHGWPTWLDGLEGDALGSGPFTPTIVGGEWLNIWCSGQDHFDCDCHSQARIKLPGGAAKIDSVTIDGVVLASSAYVVIDSNVLARIDGEPWPLRQDWAVAEGEGVFEVTYWTGIVPDSLDFMAVGILAVEFLKAIRGEKGCRLPSGATSIVRQGVSMQIEVDLFEKGLTGIREVDMATARRNPNRLRTSPRVLAPGSRRARQTTWRAS